MIRSLDGSGPAVEGAGKAAGQRTIARSGNSGVCAGPRLPAQPLIHTCRVLTFVPTDNSQAARSLAGGVPSSSCEPDFIANPWYQRKNRYNNTRFNICIQGCLRVCLTWAVDGLLKGSPYSKTGPAVEVFIYIDALTRSFAGTVGPRFTA